MNTDYRLTEILFTADVIERKVKKELAIKISRIAMYYDDPLFVCILDGAIHFFSDLTRNLRVPVEYGFLKAKSYVETESTGYVNIQPTNEYLDIEDRNIFLVEDIIDTGRTIAEVTTLLLKLGAASIHVITLLDKPSRRLKEYKDFKIDVVGWEIPDKFVVGYGLDLDGKFRSLPYIGVVGEI